MCVIVDGKFNVHNVSGTILLPSHACVRALAYYTQFQDLSFVFFDTCSVFVVNRLFKFKINQ